MFFSEHLMKKLIIDGYEDKQCIVWIILHLLIFSNSLHIKLKENYKIYSQNESRSNVNRACDFRTILLKRVRIDSLQFQQNKRRISDTLCTFKLTSSQAWFCPRVGSSCGFPDSGSSIGNLRPIQMCRYVNFIILFVEYRLYDLSADGIVATRISRLIYNFVCKLTVPSISSFLDFRLLETYVACRLRETLYHIRRNIAFGYN